MPAYQVTRTPGGGYWVRQGDAIDLAAGAAGAAAGSALGIGINAVRRSRAQGNYRRHEAALDQIERAIEAEDWDAVGELATDHIRRYPTDENGYEAMALALWQHETLTPQVRLQGSQMVQHHLSDPSSAYLVRCRAYRDLEDMPHLLQEANQLITYGQEPTLRAVGYRLRGEALMWLGDLDQAMADANSSLSLAPEASAYALRGDIHWAKGNTDQAIAEYTMAIRVDPEYESWFEKRASTLESLGRGEEAAADRQRAQQMRWWQPTHAVPHTGANVWTTPDPNLPAASTLAPGTRIRVAEVLGAWARIDARNTWTGWVDGRVLQPLTFKEAPLKG